MRNHINIMGQKCIIAGIMSKIFKINAEPPLPPTPTLCLNMIVKNESRIIGRLLESVYPFIDSYCICDTGSTDNTAEMIRAFFDSKQIPGKVIFEPFRDFGYNRSFALAACKNMVNADYVLLLDADMVFTKSDTVSIPQFKNILSADAYYVFQGNDHMFYKNVRIVKNNRDFSYWGVTHEYVKSPPGTIYATLDRNVCFINDIGDGGAKSDKFLRDIRLLTKGLEENPDNDRYTFYIANSYRDSGQTEKAIEFYKKRVEIGGWVEEVWYSLYQLGKIYKNTGDHPNAIHHFLEAYQRYPQRIENLYEIVNLYRDIGKNNLAHEFFVWADRARTKYTSTDYLFMQKDIYDYKLDYELSIIGFYANPDNRDMRRVSHKVLNHPGAEESITKNVMSNYKFYANKLVNSAIPIPEQQLNILASVGLAKLASVTGFVSSTPSITVSDEDELCVCLRLVNYRINEKGGYENQQHIETINMMAIIDTTDPNEWKKVREFELGYDTAHDGLYVGLEDVRLLTTKGYETTYFNANRGLDRHKVVLEHGTVDFLMKSTNVPSNLLSVPGKASDIEKNWVLFEAADNSLKCVYHWSPLQIGDIKDSQWIKTNEIPVPPVFEWFRGSTNGIIVDDTEVWFINHIVSYEDRRYYYHVVTVLDRATFAPKKYTVPWTFEGSPVEYTLGMTYDANTRQFLIGYSVLDKETKYVRIGRDFFEDQFIVL